MGGLEPAVLLSFGLDILIAHDGEKNVGAVADQSGEAFARSAVAFGDGIRLGRSHGRDHLAIVAA